MNSIPLLIIPDNTKINARTNAWGETGHLKFEDTRRRLNRNKARIGTFKISQIPNSKISCTFATTFKHILLQR